jgi:hypothetical protein
MVVMGQTAAEQRTNPPALARSLPPASKFQNLKGGRGGGDRDKEDWLGPAGRRLLFVALSPTPGRRRRRLPLFSCVGDLAASWRAVVLFSAAAASAAAAGRSFGWLALALALARGSFRERTNPASQPAMTEPRRVGGHEKRTGCRPDDVRARTDGAGWVRDVSCRGWGGGLQLDPRWHGSRRDASASARRADDGDPARNPTGEASHLGQKSRWPCLAACVCTGSMAGRLSLLDPPERVGI